MDPTHEISLKWIHDQLAQLTRPTNLVYEYAFGNQTNQLIITSSVRCHNEWTEEIGRYGGTGFDRYVPVKEHHDDPYTNMDVLTTASSVQILPTATTDPVLWFSSSTSTSGTSTTRSTLNIVPKTIQLDKNVPVYGIRKNTRLTMDLNVRAGQWILIRNKFVTFSNSRPTAHELKLVREEPLEEANSATRSMGVDIVEFRYNPKLFCLQFVGTYA